MRRIEFVLIAALAFAAAACGAGERPAPRVGPPGTIAISLEDTLGETFSLELVEVRIDGRIALQCGGAGAKLDARSPLTLYRGSAGPGEHEIAHRLVYRSNGAGIFSYLQGYTFDVKARHEVDLPPAGDLWVHAIAHEYGGPTTPLEERPKVRFEEAGADERPAGAIGCPTGSRTP
jgi:hypothetical protein